MTLNYEKTNIWKNATQEQLDKIYDYGERYKSFLDSSKTEREACSEIIKQAEENGYISLEDALKSKIQKGDKIYLNNKNKSVVLMIVGDDLSEGMNIVGAHIDAPRLDLKQNPLYEEGDLALLKTHYYGGVKKYQWTTIPLALHGLIITKDGTKLNISIGDEENDPVFYINDLLIHLSSDQLKKTLAEGITGEQLNVVVAHNSKFPEEDSKNPIKDNLLKYLNKKYGIVEEDFLVAELQIVPASKARDVGFDRAMIAAHGHDDRVCSYAALEAILKTNSPSRTAVALFVDKEEIGSVGNTSMGAIFLENMVAEILSQREDYSDILVRRSMANSKVLSADVTVAYDPTFPEVLEKNNASLLGHGVTMAKYTGSRGKGGCNDANSEFIAELRDLFNKENIIWQTGELGKVDQGGGGTIAYILAGYGAEVVDMGTGMLSMHAPLELLSKADAYMTCKAYNVFFK
ncbi:aminopeptidase [Miniphocaeibacter massiliensis]|uniref:aminopeptidase n=1 Tax=Miniphocaeibacter massiliensis TaxID=2041841 RepID=UPI000C1C522F|nr:aminopeptidase [Miniphocaeibacter massiliensis]